MAGRTAGSRSTNLRLTGLEILSDFAAGSPFISCRVDYEAAPEDTHLLLEWRRGTETLSRVVTGIAGRGSVTVRVYDLAGTGCPPGDYRVRASCGEQYRTASFSLR
jgi:hypothetical protein